jgi:two-component system cell cycle response regulator
MAMATRKKLQGIVVHGVTRRRSPRCVTFSLHHRHFRLVKLRRSDHRSTRKTLLNGHREHEMQEAASQAMFVMDPANDIPIQPVVARRSCRVLVVDDDHLVRGRLSALLSAAQYKVEVAASGAEALRILNETECHIVLTDWQMPDMDGLALCRKVRRRVQDNYVYVLMLTIRDTQHDMLTGLAAGVDDYVVKGASTEEIIARLEIGRRITHAKHSVGSNHRHPGSADAGPVTGAHDLAYLVEHLPRELSRSQRYAHALSVLTCDIDGFDQIKQLLGNEASDELLGAFAARCEACIRRGDWLARTGCDEFVIVLPETSVKGGRRVARKLRRLFAAQPLCTPADPIGFTVRIGVTTVEAKNDPDGARRIDALLHAAGKGPSAYLGASLARPGRKNELN